MKRFLWIVLPACLMLIGCGGGETDKSSKDSSASKVDGTAYLLDAEPAESLGIIQARKDVKDGDSVTLVGRIGGSKTPFNSTLASFTIVDLEIPHCPPEENCPAPWDYCCKQNQVKDGQANIKIVKDGKTIKSEAKGLLKVKELDVVVVKGTAKRGEEGQLTVLADKVFVRK